MRFHVCLFTVLVSVFGAGSAYAGLEVCNGTDQVMDVAIAYSHGETWASNGWYNVQPRSCRDIRPGNLTHRYYYLYARTNRTTWDSGHLGDGQTSNFCTQNRRFTQYEHRNCAAFGMTSTRFFRVDTGSLLHFRTTLFDNGSQWRQQSQTLNFSYRGVTNCGNANREQEEVRNRCNNILRSRNSGPRQVDFQSMSYEVHSHRYQHRLEGWALDRRRACTGWIRATCRWRER